MKINKVLLIAVMAVVLVLVAVISYSITLHSLGDKTDVTTEENVTVPSTDVTTTENKTENTTGNTAETSTAASDVTSETAGAQQTADGQTTAASAATTVVSSGGITLLPKPTVLPMNEDKWNLTLLNKWYKLDDSYTPKLAEAVEGSGVYLEYRVAEAYSAMYAAAAAEDVELFPCSGYRSFDRQTRNYNNRVSQYLGEGYSQAEAEALTAQVIMVPGHSEHNYGLAMDIGWVSNDFAYGSAYAWLIEHAAEYGFIERYKEEKINITGVCAEPWHWRYVGVAEAAAINASGQCLEEYLGMVN